MADFILERTCGPVDLATCEIGSKHVDPCNCHGYITCTTGYTYANGSCNNSDGTLALDHNSFICDHANKILAKNICNPASPWSRCTNVTDNRLQELVQLCTGSTLSPDTTTTEQQTTGVEATTATGQSTGNKGDNTALIVGLAIALGIIFVLVIIGVVIFIQRKKARLEKEKSKPQPTIQVSANNPGYAFTDDTEVYSHIDDTAMDKAAVSRDNSYLKPSKKQQNGTLPPDGLVQTEEASEYDNSASVVRNVHPTLMNPEAEDERGSWEHDYRTVLPHEKELDSIDENERNERFEAGRRRGANAEDGIPDYLELSTSFGEAGYDTLSGNLRKGEVADTKSEDGAIKEEAYEQDKEAEDVTTDYQETPTKIVIEATPLDHAMENATYTEESDIVWSL